MFAGDPQLHIGTSSWSSRDWLGVFYPAKTPPAEFIGHYATVYDTVEIDATFYAIPPERNIASWLRRTPDDFIFSCKVPRSITHERVLVDAEAEMVLFVETMQGLGDKLGPMLLQFPYFNRKAFSSVEPFLERLDAFLDRLPRDLKIVVEVRNPQWVGRPLHRVCERHHAAIAFVEQAWMPPARAWLNLLGEPTADFGYVRWLGDHKEIEKLTTTWEKTVWDREREMQEWIPIVKALRGAGVDVFGYFNNHFAGHAPASIESFRALWQQSEE